MPNPVMHFEVLGKDGSRLQRFYGDLFDWTIDADNPMSYGLVDTGSGVGGGIGGVPEGQPGMVTFYVQVEDIDAALRRAEELGGRTVNPPMEVPGGPTIAHFADPDGNVIGLLKADSM